MTRSWGHCLRGIPQGNPGAIPQHLSGTSPAIPKGLGLTADKAGVKASASVLKANPPRGRDAKLRDSLVESAGLPPGFTGSDTATGLWRTAKYPRRYPC